MKRKQGRRRSQPEDIAEVLDRIEHWRKTRLKRSPMPEELWDAAASLLRTHGAYPVAKALRVNYAALKKRAEQNSLNGPDRKNHDGFVELSAAQLIGTPPQVGTVVEVEERDGVRMTIRVAGGNPVDVAGLVAAFRSRRA